MKLPLRAEEGPKEGEVGADVPEDGVVEVEVVVDGGLRCDFDFC